MGITVEGFEFSPAAEQFARAVRAIVRDRHISAGAIHRELRCGYSHAVILIDQMRAEGIIVRNGHGHELIVKSKTEFAFKAE